MTFFSSIWDSTAQVQDQFILDQFILEWKSSTWCKRIKGLIHVFFMTSYVTDIVRTIQDRRKSGPKTFKN